MPGGEALNYPAFIVLTLLSAKCSYRNVKVAETQAGNQRVESSFSGMSLSKKVMRIFLETPNKSSTMKNPCTFRRESRGMKFPGLFSTS